MITSYGKLVSIVLTLLVMVRLGGNVGLRLNVVRFGRYIWLGRLMAGRSAALQGVLGLKFKHQ